MRILEWSSKSRLLAISVIGLVTLCALLVRLPGLQPASLWLDDQWVAVLATVAPISYVVTGDYPCPPGLILLMRAVVAIFGKGEWQLQAIPFVSSLAAIPLFAWVTMRATGNRMLGIIAAVLIAANMLLSMFGVRVKPFAVDALATIYLLALAISYIDGGHIRQFATLAIVAALLPLFSWPALIIGSILVITLGGAALIRRDNRAQATKLLGWMLVYALAALSIYLLTMRGRGSPILYTHWDANYLPANDWGTLPAFLADSGVKLFTRAFPKDLSWFALAVPVGFAALLLDRRLRALGIAILSIYAALFLASALHLYPVGGGRTDIFSFPLTIFTAVSALMLLRNLSRPAWLFRVAGLAAPVIALLLVTHFGVRLPGISIKYPDSGGAQVVARAAEITRDGDALVIFTWTNWAVGFYGPWPVRIDEGADPSNSNAFFVRPLRAHTLVPDNSWSGIRINQDRVAVREQLLPFLRTSPKRLIYLIDQGPNNANQWFVETIIEAGYQFDHQEHPGGATLIVFER